MTPEAVLSNEGQSIAIVGAHTKLTRISLAAHPAEHWISIEVCE
jgi:hypothetical protein